uniref:Reverse transcriptase domain-containing protein n=1 Tax=Magallana gigas TaxID=29159 RepID=A0A8W8LWK4_MAGGI
MGLKYKAWEDELKYDPDKMFLLSGIKYGFDIIDSDADPSQASCNNHPSAQPNSPLYAKATAQINIEIQNGNYIQTHEPPVIISPLGVIPKPDGSVRLIHDCSRPQGLSVNDNVSNKDKHKYNSVDSASKLVHKGYYMAKVDLKSAYRSVPISTKSQLVTVPSWGHFDPNKHLCLSNIKFGADGVTVHWSKTIQYSQRSLEIPLPLIPNSPFCPSTALMLLFKSTPCSIQSVPAFIFRQQSSTKLMTYDIFVSRLSYNPSRYSAAHSFRRGGASFALQCGLPPDLIQTQGDWCSDVYKTYLDPSLSFRQQVATTLGQSIGKVL